MSNITLSVEDNVIKKIRKIAIDKNTTLTAMVREYLILVAEQDSQARKSSMKSLAATFKKYSRDMGKRSWKREDLYDRS